jgi:hypothetical protein
VTFEQIPALPARLANMSEAEIRAKRAALREVHRRFIWDDEYGTAYESVLDALRVRRARGRGG